MTSQGRGTTGWSFPQELPGSGTGGLHAFGEALRILVVDDDEGCRLGIASILGEDGHDILTAARGEEAIEHARFLRREKKRLDLSILDFNMPDLNGIETFRRLVVEFPGLVGVFVSGESSEALVEQIRLAGGSALVRKPLDVGRVRWLVYRFLAGGEFFVA